MTYLTTHNVLGCALLYGKFLLSTLPFLDRPMSRALRSSRVLQRSSFSGQQQISKGVICCLEAL